MIDCIIVWSCLKWRDFDRKGLLNSGSSFDVCIGLYVI